MGWSVLFPRCQVALRYELVGVGEVLGIRLETDGLAPDLPGSDGESTDLEILFGHSKEQDQWRM